MTKNENPIIYLMRKTWRYSDNKKRVTIFIVMSILANLMGLIEPLIIAKVLNTIQEQGVTKDNMYSIIGYFAIFIILWIILWALHGPSRVIERRNAFICRANYKKYLIDGTLDLPAEWHTDHHSGDTIDKIEKGTAGLYEFSGHIFEIISAFVKLIGAYIALVYFNIHSTYIVLVMMILTFSIILRFDKTLVKMLKELYRKENRISEKIFDIISNITTVIILRIERLVSKAILKRIMDPFKLYSRHAALDETKWFTVSFFSSIMMFLVLSSYVFFNIETGLLVGTIFALYGYLIKITNVFFHFAYRYGDIVKWRTQVANAEEISDGFKERKKVAQETMDSWKELSVRNLKFSYHMSETDLHLDNVSMNIKKGQRVALIGSSGSGKTTFLKLMRDLYHPGKVSVKIDDKEMDYGFKSISSKIALIPQDPEIFSTTIKENITLGVQHTLKDIKKYTDMACFTNVVKRLPNKWSSSIVEKGVNLSGGEKQRLALARGLMASKDKEIILFDEPTSSVDMKNELKIFENIFKRFKKKTIIASVHRLHLLMLFDYIYFFKNGKIIAEGNFRTLLKESADFQKIWDKYQKTKSLEYESY